MPTEPLESPSEPPNDERKPIPLLPCDKCGTEIFGVKGSKHAVCHNCGHKESCC